MVDCDICDILRDPCPLCLSADYGPDDCVQCDSMRSFKKKFDQLHTTVIIIDEEYGPGGRGLSAQMWTKSIDEALAYIMEDAMYYMEQDDVNGTDTYLMTIKNSTVELPFCSSIIGQEIQTSL